MRVSRRKVLELHDFGDGLWNSAWDISFVARHHIDCNRECSKNQRDDDGSTECLIRHTHREAIHCSQREKRFDSKAWPKQGSESQVDYAVHDSASIHQSNNDPDDMVFAEADEARHHIRRAY